MVNPDSLLISDLRGSYLAKRFTPAEIMGHLMDSADRTDERLARAGGRGEPTKLYIVTVCSD
jgi:hypothetical protein